MSKRFWISALLLSLSVFAGSALAEPISVSSVSVKGNDLIDSQAILINLQTKVGVVERSTISSDLKTLYKMGFFEEASVNIYDSASYGRSVEFFVVEKPTARKILIKGNEDLGLDDLAEVLKLDQNRFVDKHILRNLEMTAENTYQAQGYYDAKISHSVEKVGNNQVDVTFKIKEGPAYKIREVRIAGARQSDPDEILSALQTARYKWWSSWLFGTGRLNQDLVDNDKLLIQQYLLDHGFVEAKVAPAEVTKKSDGLYVRWSIEEGKEYKIGAIRAAGDLIANSQTETLADIKTEAGEVFSASKVRADTFVVADKFGDQGYAFANVVPDTKINRQAGVVDIEFRTEKGMPVVVDEIKISGNTKTYDNVIRREFKLNEKELYSSTKIKRAETLLKRSGYFEDVTISTESSDDPNEVDLNVNVKEGPTGSFSAGAGYSTADGAIVSSNLTERNVMGTGRKLSLGADVGADRESLLLSLDDPRFQDSYWAVGTDISKSQRQYSDFDRGLTGGSLSVGYPLEELAGTWAEDVNLGLKYQYWDIEIDDIDPADAAQLVIDSEGTSTASAVIPSIVRNTINNPMNPTSGSRQVLSLEMAGLGGSEDYYLAEFKNTYYTPLVKFTKDDLVFSWRFNAGYGESNTDEPFPLFRRYFPGGINSVRGYQFRTLGPKDENGNEYGGSKELVNNLEMIFPLIPSAGFKGVIFFDAGQAFDDEVSIEIAELRLAYGYGIRWMSPIGPIRVEIGHPIDKEEDEDSLVTLFSFGAPL
jgi:outer membrane protein insertion porin family